MENGREILVPREAIWNDLVMDTGISYILLSGSLIAVFLPMIFFFSYYLRDNSIYTIFRLPEKGKVRFFTYIDLLTPSIILGFLLWVTQIIMILLFYWLYLTRVPTLNQQDQFLAYFFQNNQFLNIYFPQSYFNLLYTIEYWILLPSVGMLIVFLGRNMKKCFLAIFLLFIIGLTIYAMAIPQKEGWQEILTKLSPIVTAASIATGLYYINKGQLI
jgi:hypothetical protein